MTPSAIGFTRTEVVKILYRVIRDACRFTDSRVEHKHIQLITDD